MVNFDGNRKEETKYRYGTTAQQGPANGGGDDVEAAAEAEDMATSIPICASADIECLPLSCGNTTMVETKYYLTGSSSNLSDSALTDAFLAADAALNKTECSPKVVSATVLERSNRNFLHAVGNEVIYFLLEVSQLASTDDPLYTAEEAEQFLVSYNADETIHDSGAVFLDLQGDPGPSTAPSSASTTESTTPLLFSEASSTGSPTESTTTLLFSQTPSAASSTESTTTQLFSQAPSSASPTESTATTSPTLNPTSRSTLPGMPTCGDLGFDFGWRMMGCVDGSSKAFTSLDERTRSKECIDEAMCNFDVPGTFDLTCADPLDGEWITAIIKSYVSAAVIIQGELGMSLYPLIAGASYTLTVGGPDTIRYLEFCFSCSDEGASAFCQHEDTTFHSSSSPAGSEEPTNLVLQPSLSIAPSFSDVPSLYQQPTASASPSMPAVPTQGPSAGAPSPASQQTLSESPNASAMPSASTVAPSASFAPSTASAPTTSAVPSSTSSPSSAVPKESASPSIAPNSSTVPSIFDTPLGSASPSAAKPVASSHSERPSIQPTTSLLPTFLSASPSATSAAPAASDVSSSLGKEPSVLSGTLQTAAPSLSMAPSALRATPSASSTAPSLRPKPFFSDQPSIQPSAVPSPLPTKTSATPTMSDTASLSLERSPSKQPNIPPGFSNGLSESYDFGAADTTSWPMVIYTQDGENDCASNYEEHSVTFDLRSSFSDHDIISCSKKDDFRITQRIVAALNAASPHGSRGWDSVAFFEAFQFDSDKTIENKGPMRQRDLKNKKRQLCPDREFDCPSSVDICRFGCGLLAMTECNENGVIRKSDYGQDNHLSATVTKALESLDLDCLGLKPREALVQIIPRKESNALKGAKEQVIPLEDETSGTNTESLAAKSSWRKEQTPAARPVVAAAASDTGSKGQEGAKAMRSQKAAKASAPDDQQNSAATPKPEALGGDARDPWIFV
jgi:hypothetical protein